MKEGLERLYLQAGLFDVVSQVWERRVTAAGNPVEAADVISLAPTAVVTGEEASLIRKVFEHAEGLSTTELYALRIKLGLAFLRELDHKLAAGETL